MTEKTGIQAAVEKFDGVPSRLADAIGNGVLRQHVEHWLKVGRVSAERCPDVSAATGIPCELLNDKVNWPLVRLFPPVGIDVPLQHQSQQQGVAHA